MKNKQQTLSDERTMNLATGKVEYPEEKVKEAVKKLKESGCCCTNTHVCENCKIIKEVFGPKLT